MADISKITLPSNTTYDIKDATARQSVEGKQDTITANGILQGDGSGNITAVASSTADTRPLYRCWRPQIIRPHPLKTGCTFSTCRLCS